MHEQKWIEWRDIRSNGKRVNLIWLPLSFLRSHFYYFFLQLIFLRFCFVHFHFFLSETLVSHNVPVLFFLFNFYSFFLLSFLQRRQFSIYEEEVNLNSSNCSTEIKEERRRKFETERNEKIKTEKKKIGIET